MPAAHNKGRHDRLTGHAFCAATACCKLLLVPDVKLTHRTQLFLTDAQYRWLKVRAASAGSIAQVVRDWIDSEMSVDPVKLRDDPLISFMLDGPHGSDDGPITSVTTIDEDLYG